MEEFGGPVVIILLFLALFVGGIFVGDICIKNTVRDLTPQINTLGYTDIPDIRVFLRRIGGSLEDFISSEGLRKQYDLFKSGASSNFIKEAESKKKADDAESSGRAQGIAIGIGSGMAISSGR